MKHNLITLTALSAVLIALAALAGCQRENIAPAASATDQATEVIPVWVEGMPDTKMTVNSTTGICAWEENDPVALYISGTSADKYVNYPVVDGSVRLSLASGQSRANYAIYPAGSAPASGYNTPTVTYPTTYNMALIPEANYADWCPAPMVAVNSGAALKFYHVGALVKLTLDYVPSGTKTIEITFTGKTVTGTFAVSDAGSAAASATSTSSTNSTVTFNNLNITGSTVTLNVPIPLGDYSSLTAISADMKNSGGASLFSVSNTVSGWGTVVHGQGKKITILTTTISGGTGLFRGYEVSKGVLKWDADKNAYTLTDGTDPLELLQHYYYDGKTNGFDGTPATHTDLNVYFHNFRKDSDPTCLKYRLDGNYADEDIQNPYIVVDGLLWKIPNQGTNTNANTTDWYTIPFGYNGWSGSSGGKGGTSITDPNVNGTANNTSYSVRVLVDLSDATIENGAAADYHDKGLTAVTKNASGEITDCTNLGANTAGNTGYQAGVLLIPDGCIIYCPNFTDLANNASYYSNLISYSLLKEFIDGGCVFLPCAGYLSNSTWQYPGLWAMYSSSTRLDNTHVATFLSVKSAMGYDRIAPGDYVPTHLVR